MQPTKQQLVSALRAFVAQRPRLEPGNYATIADYRAESRMITGQRDDALSLLAAIDARESITAADMLAMLRDRLQWDADRGELEYTTGQYWPTEYRRAVALACAGMLWAYWREDTPADHPDRGDAIRRRARLAFHSRRLRSYFR